MKTGHAVIVYQPGVGAIGQQQPCDLGVPAVAGPVQCSGAPVGLRVTLGPTLQQELTHSIVSVATGIVLQDQGVRPDGGLQAAGGVGSMQACTGWGRSGLETSQGPAPVDV